LPASLKAGTTDIKLYSAHSVENHNFRNVPQSFRQYPTAEYISRLAPNGCLIDVKSILDPEEVQKTGTPFWRL
jgi:hypothetical protein